jgi:hypothetical protein
MMDDLEKGLAILLEWYGFEVVVWQSSHGPAYCIGDHGYFDSFGKALEALSKEEIWW